ncbi:iso-A82775C biosynthesis cluster protein B-like [Raphanus sativus]|uniref:Iso-A82775C biosynthesis cluster protein B-like n=1 Tax=Raphanus sativus TaxID=3726 RepID=A0A9W3CRU1_RAPSA|nr:iso-A82775C biosynthesis cluster protein B-like [Raphanus sativus]
MSEWFTDLEEAAYSVVEFIPLVGTVYSLKRASIAYSKEDWVRHWQSVGNFLESSVRDVILFNEIVEFPEVALIHTMAESFTDKMIEIYHREPKKPEIQITKNLDEESGHVLIAESSEGKFASQVFGDKAKGVHHFHGAVFTGTLYDTNYAPNGEKIRLDIPQGLYDGAPVTFSWKWTSNYLGEENVPEATYGRIKLIAGTPTGFKLSDRKGAAGWEGYNFWGQVYSKDQINVNTSIDGGETQIVFNRLAET